MQPFLRHLVIGFISVSASLVAQANDRLIPINSASEQALASFTPIFDFHDNGCLPDVGVDAQGSMNPGVESSGGLGEGCRNPQFLQHSNTLHRGTCLTSAGKQYCGHIFSLYFAKDQSQQGQLSGHRHDWEFAVVYTVNGTPTHAGYSAHGKVFTQPLEQLERQGQHVKVVYQKDGDKTHALSFAEPNAIAQNPYQRFVTPPVISWSTMRSTFLSNAELRQSFTQHDFDKGNVPVINGNFIRNLNKNRPAEYPEF